MRWQYARGYLRSNEANAFRLVHAESDGLPGLVVDRYGDTLVVQFLSCGAERWRESIVRMLIDLSGAQRIYERSDVEVRALEGLPPRVGWLAGEPTSGNLCVFEEGLSFWVDVLEGHKTGFYLDQRANRQQVREFAAGREMLDCFSYTGGFSLAALAGGATSVMMVDSSASALALAR